MVVSLRTDFIHYHYHTINELYPTQFVLIYSMRQSTSMDTFSRVLNLLIQVYGHVFSRIKVSTESREFTFGKT